MTDDETALLAAIAGYPDDDTVRLVYADWLGENNQPDRAEFIRVQIELAQLRDSVISRLFEKDLPTPDPLVQRHSALGTRTAELLKNHEAAWLESCGIGRTRDQVEREKRSVFGCCNRHADNMACSCVEDAVGVTWRRGFVDTVTVRRYTQVFVRDLIPCRGCGGDGEVDVYEGLRVGTCSRCNGNGVLEVPTSNPSDRFVQIFSCHPAITYLVIEDQPAFRQPESDVASARINADTVRSYVKAKRNV